MLRSNGIHYGCDSIRRIRAKMIPGLLDVSDLLWPPVKNEIYYYVHMRNAKRTIRTGRKMCSGSSRSVKGQQNMFTVESSSASEESAR